MSGHPAASTYEERMAIPAYAAHVQGIVDQAPPATDEDVRILRGLIQGGRREAARATAAAPVSMSA